MTIDSQKALQEANKLIILHDSELSFDDLIEHNLKTFSQFRLIYSTNNTTSKFGYTSLDEIEKQCASLKKFFYGDGLLFFSSSIYKLHKECQSVQIPLDYSLSLDSNIAEKFIIYENGGKLETKDKDRLDNLLKFIRNYKFNFDYSFFCLENLEFLKTENKLPFNTLRAIIKCNPLNHRSLDREEAGKLAYWKIHNFYADEINLYFWTRRKVIYAALIKAILINWKATSLKRKLERIIVFQLEKLGKFAKKEIYLAWKLFKYGDSLHFFYPVNRPSNKILSRARGMSYDFLSIEYQAMLAYNLSVNDTFFIPFFASFDDRFTEFREACPIKCMLFGNYNQGAHTYFNDGLELERDINDVIESNYDIYYKITNTQAIYERRSSELDNKKLDNIIFEIEEAIRSKL